MRPSSRPESHAGKEIFTQASQPPCALCHTLADAGPSGEIGADLDDLKPSAERVRKAVKGGVENMPAYDDTSSDKQIASVAQNIARTAAAP